MSVGDSHESSLRTYLAVNRFPVLLRWNEMSMILTSHLGSCRGNEAMGSNNEMEEGEKAFKFLRHQNPTLSIQTVHPQSNNWKEVEVKGRKGNGKVKDSCSFYSKSNRNAEAEANDFISSLVLFYLSGKVFHSMFIIWPMLCYVTS